MAAQVFSGCMNLVGRRSFLRKKKIDQILHFLFEIDTFRTEWCKEVKKILTEVSHRWYIGFQKKISLYNECCEISTVVHCDAKFRSQACDGLAVCSVWKCELQGKPGGCLHGVQRFSAAGMDFLLIKLPGISDRVFYFGKTEWFFDVVDCFELNSSFEIFFVRVAAHKNGNTVRKKLFQTFQHGDAVHAGHADITQDDLRFVKSGSFQSVYTIIGLNHLIDSER